MYKRDCQFPTNIILHYRLLYMLKSFCMIFLVRRVPDRGSRRQAINDTRVLAVMPENCGVSPRLFFENEQSEPESAVQFSKETFFASLARKCYIMYTDFGPFNTRHYYCCHRRRCCCGTWPNNVSAKIYYYLYNK